MLIVLPRRREMKVH